MKALRYRFITIGVLLAISIISLLPRDTVVLVPAQDGSPARFDTVKRVPLKRGLDLKGGMYISLVPDESRGAVNDLSDLLDRALKIYRNRIDEMGVSDPNVQKTERGIIIELPGIDDPKRAQEIVSRSAELHFKITDETRELERAIPLMDAALRRLGIASAGADSQSARGSALNILQATGDSIKPVIDSTGLLSKRIVPGGAGMPGEYMVDASEFRAVDAWMNIPEVKAVLRPGKEFYWGGDTLVFGGTAYRPLYLVDTKSILNGQDLTNATASQNPDGGVQVNFEVNASGGRRLFQETSAHLYDYMAIILDNRVMGQPPEIRGEISRSGRITMPGKPLAEAVDLALVLRAGALPAAFTISEQRNIGPSLGQDSIDKGVRAAGLAVLLVIVAVGVYYRFAGLLAIAGLGCYMLLTLGVLAGLQAVITLPGIAGFVLSIGIAVDANVLIFERIREELDSGKTVRTAVDEGFRHAMTAIIDSNVTTILTALILYQFGTGPVRGFAVTLIAGILASMVTGIFIVRTFFLAWMARNKRLQALSI
jgi:preprotein translocase subunit SecD